MAWTCLYRRTAAVGHSVNLRNSFSPPVTSAIPCVGGRPRKDQVFVLTVLPGLQDQQRRPHLCLHSTTESVWLTKGILFFGWYWAACRNTHRPYWFHHWTVTTTTTGQNNCEVSVCGFTGMQNFEITPFRTQKSRNKYPNILLWACSLVSLNGCKKEKHLHFWRYSTKLSDYF